jgi:hypothetical protein
VEIRLQKEKNRRLQREREEYFKKHGRWPEEDGINIAVIKAK